jgi:release factor glutamine methyltransferase
MRHVLSVEPGWLITHTDDELDAEDLAGFEELLARRLDGQPIAYLVGSREFWSMDIRVTPDVLIPRPETETLVELALGLIPPGEESRIVDLGTGSGAIALAIASERPDCRVTAIENSPVALLVAQDNADRLGLAGIEFLPGDWYAPLVDRKFDLIVSNPPYVPDNDEHLQRGDVRFEPQTALRGGEHGLDEISRIITGAGDHLEPDGKLLIEHGFNQGAAIRAELGRCEIYETETFPDISGTPRVTLACNVSQENLSSRVS